MGNFSTRQELYINKFNNPKIQDMEKLISIRGTVVPGEKFLIFEDGKNFCNPLKSLVSDKDISHAVVITSVYCSFLRNETKHDLILNLNNVFHGNNMNQDVKHEDDTGCLKIFCPASYDGPVNGVDSLVYKPRIQDHILRAYAGMQLPEDDEQLVFEKSHPLVHFILHHTKSPQYTELDGYLKFEKEYLDKMKLYFKTTVYDQIHVTRFESTKIQCELPQVDDKPKKIQPSLTLIIQFNYFLIMPGENKMKHLAVKL
jgi:hypothetical protein